MHSHMKTSRVIALALLSMGVSACEAKVDERLSDPVHEAATKLGGLGGDGSRGPAHPRGRAARVSEGSSPNRAE